MENTQNTREPNAFREMNLLPEIIRAIEGMGFSEATTVQKQTILPMMEWRDVVAKAPTGTGKTVAFAVPLLQHADPAIRKIQSLILCPTRELAMQICGEIRKLSAHMKGIKTLAVYGGQNIERQIVSLKAGPQIVVATPGRLIDHMHRGTINLSAVSAVVLDEADRMLDMGFVREVTSILDSLPNRRHVAMMSATISREVMDIGWIYQRDPVEIDVAQEEEDKPPIEQYSVEATGNKLADIVYIVKCKEYKRVIVFCNTKHLVRRLAINLENRGYSAACLHGDVKQSTRERVMADFRKGKYNMLIATDVAARGLDIDGVDAVFNYDVPRENEYYLHRIGRTGRAKRHGVAYTLVSPLDIFRLEEIARYTREEMTPLKFDSQRRLVSSKE